MTRLNRRFCSSCCYSRLVALLGIPLLSAILPSGGLSAAEQELHNIAANVSTTRAETRGIGAARRWIEAEFIRIAADCDGCLEVFTVSGVVSGTARIPDLTAVVNVIAVQRGTQD